MFLRHNRISHLIEGVCFSLVKTHAPASYTFNGMEVDCVAAIGVMCFSGVHFGVRPFLTKEAATMDVNYFTDTLFDLINESDVFDADLSDIKAENGDLVVQMKDGTVFKLHVEGIN